MVVHEFRKVSEGFQEDYYRLLHEADRLDEPLSDAGTACATGGGACCMQADKLPFAGLL